MGEKIEAENATVLPTGILKKMCLSEEKENTAIRCIGLMEQILPSGTR